MSEQTKQTFIPWSASDSCSSSKRSTVNIIYPVNMWNKFKRKYKTKWMCFREFQSALFKIHVNKHSHMRKVVGSKLEYAYWKACTDNNNALVWLSSSPLKNIQMFTYPQVLSHFKYPLTILSIFWPFASNFWRLMPITGEIIAKASVIQV